MIDGKTGDEVLRPEPGSQAYGACSKWVSETHAGMTVNEEWAQP